MNFRSLIASACVMVAASAPAAEPNDVERPVELGQVQWLRDYDDAVRRAKEEHKPLLILFSEVPGCETCRSYGSDILSHPLIVDAIETRFIPLAVYNNVEGRDRDLVTSFCEATWSNPVVRFVDVTGPSRADLAPRLADNFSLVGLAGAMVGALESHHSVVPLYLSHLRQEENARAKPVPPAVFAMASASDGEEKLGAFSGVVDTRVGTLEGRQVVEFHYDQSSITFANLIREARRQGCLDYVFARSDDQLRYSRRIVGDNVKWSFEPVQVSESESLKRLRASFYRAVPMTPMQARRVNAALAAGENPDDHLSLRQVRFRGLAARHPDADWPPVAGRHDLIAAFEEAEHFAATLEKPAE